MNIIKTVFGFGDPPKPNSGNPQLDAAVAGTAGVIKGAVGATTTAENYGEIADFLKNLTAAGAAAAKCIAGKIGWPKLIALSVAAASGAGSGALVAAITPHVIPCGLAALVSEMGSSPLETAIKQAAAEYGKGMPGYVDPKLQALIDDPTIASFFTSGALKAGLQAQSQISTVALSPAEQADQQIRANAAPAALAIAALLLLR